MKLKQYILNNFSEDKLLYYLVDTLNTTLGKEGYYDTLVKYVKVNKGIYAKDSEVYDLSAVTEVLTDYEKLKIQSINTVLNNEDLSYCSKEQLKEVYDRLDSIGG